MRFAKKMMLVPAGRGLPELETMTALDNEMASVLKNQQLSAFDKINMYNQILNKNMVVEARVKQQKVSNSENKKKKEVKIKTEPTGGPVSEVNVDDVEEEEGDTFYDTLSFDENASDMSVDDVKSTTPMVVKKELKTKNKLNKKLAQVRTSTKKKLVLNSSKTFCVDKWCPLGRLRVRKPISYAPTELSFNVKSPRMQYDPDYDLPNKKLKAQG
jgi:hypothetical protein